MSLRRRCDRGRCGGDCDAGYVKLTVRFEAVDFIADNAELESVAKLVAELDEFVLELCPACVPQVVRYMRSPLKILPPTAVKIRKKRAKRKKAVEKPVEKPGKSVSRQPLPPAPSAPSTPKPPPAPKI